MVILFWLATAGSHAVSFRDKKRTITGLDGTTTFDVINILELMN
jgi:hypothetical protein